MQRFLLNRFEDLSGNSGTGVVAEGVVFSDGSVVMHWLVEPCTTTHYKCIADVERLHGHQGRTEVRVIDQDLTLPVPVYAAI